MIFGLQRVKMLGEDFQPMWSWSTNVTDGQTDGRTDDMR